MEPDSILREIGSTVWGKLGSLFDFHHSNPQEPLTAAAKRFNDEWQESSVV